MFRQSDLAQYVHQGVEFVSKLIFRLNRVSYYIHQGREFMAPYINQGLEFACLHFLNFALKDVSWKQFDCLAVHGCGNWTNHSVLALEASSTDDNESKLITVVNLTTRLWQECPVGTLAKTERDHCPENAISAHGQQWIHVSMLIFICVFVLGAGLTYKKEECGRFLFWTALFLFWAADCGAGLWSGMAAQMIVAPISSAQIWPAILMDPFRSSQFWSLVWNVLVFDLPMWVVKLLSNCIICLPEGLRNLVYIIFTTSYGLFFSRRAIGWANEPATVIVFGHNALLVGVQTFFLQFPKMIIMNHIKKCIARPLIHTLGFDDYRPHIFVNTEIHWVWEHLAQPLPRSIVCVMEEEVEEEPRDPENAPFIHRDPPVDPALPARIRPHGRCKKLMCVSCFLVVTCFLVSSFLVCGVLCRAPVCLPKPSQIGGCEQFYATLRDFKSSHPDFENPANNGIWSATKGLVDKKLGEDGKPVFIGGRTLSSQGNFNEWYNNVRGKNKEEHVTLHMTRTAAGTLVMDSPNFFPLDGKGFRDEVFGHNYFFTMEMHHTFVYKGGERFTFFGDDDFWVFINGQLALDLGGTHTPLEETIDLDKLGLTRGRRASLDLFYAERHTKTSSLRIETTAQLEQENCCVVGLTRIATYLMKQYENLLAYIMRGQKSGDM